MGERKKLLGEMAEKAKIAANAEKLTKLKHQLYLKNLEGKLDPEKKRKLFEMGDTIEKKITQESDELNKLAARTKNSGIVKGTTEHIDTMTPWKMSNVDDVMGRAGMKKVSKLGKLGKVAGKFGKAGLKSIPLLGGIATALATKDASAAIPILNEADDLGPVAGSPSSVLEDPNASLEARKRAIELLKMKTRGE